MFFHPLVPGKGSGNEGWPDVEDVSVEQADEMTLDAASRLMPLLPRDLIAEYLGLGSYRHDGGSHILSK